MSPDQLEALVRTTSIDPNRVDLVLRVEVRPGPGLAGTDGVSVNRPVSIDVIGGTGKASYRYGPGDRISPVDVTIGLAALRRRRDRLVFPEQQSARRRGPLPHVLASTAH